MKVLKTNKNMSDIFHTEFRIFDGTGCMPAEPKDDIEEPKCVSLLKDIKFETIQGDLVELK